MIPTRIAPGETLGIERPLQVEEGPDRHPIPALGGEAGQVGMGDPSSHDPVEVAGRLGDHPHLVAGRSIAVCHRNCPGRPRSLPGWKISDGAKDNWYKWPGQAELSASNRSSESFGPSLVTASTPEITCRRVGEEGR